MMIKRKYLWFMIFVYFSGCSMGVVATCAINNDVLFGLPFIVVGVFLMIMGMYLAPPEMFEELRK